jgi:ABC-type multidrug transport system fused ATPase/permease subunit
MQNDTYKAVFQFYKARLQKTANELSSVKKGIYLLGSLRLLVFVVCVTAAFLLHSRGNIIFVLSLGVFLFLALLLRYNQRRKRKHYLETSIACDENELKGLNYDFSAFDGAPEKIDASHPFTFDLDIFGLNSLFQSINRTCTNYGKKILIQWFEKPSTDSNLLQARQEAIKELSGNNFFIHHFRVSGLIEPGNDSDYEAIETFVNSPDSIAPKRFWKTTSLLLPCLWIILVAGSLFHLLPFGILAFFYIISLIISESRTNRINRLQESVGKKVKILHSYFTLIETIENEQFQSAVLSELQFRFKKKHDKASVRFKKLVHLVNELEQRNNLLIHLIFNPLLLWDIRKAIRIDQWKQQNGGALIEWITTLGELDAYCSLGLFSFNHPDYTFPVFSGNYFTFNGRELGHPLKNRDSFIKNDIDIEKHPFFMIITGANMAGKSTYLRTLGVNFVLACIGAPVCAQSLTLYPACLVSSLRTSDSLLENESYFFAELKRLKMIIDRLQSGEKLFILLDEILKGTNSVDKQKGSLALIQQFLRLQSCGIIATHDLQLGNLADQFPENIKNFRFEADIKEDELSFSYRLRSGIAQNMNACFLMQKMGIR